MKKQTKISQVQNAEDVSENDYSKIIMIMNLKVHA